MRGLLKKIKTCFKDFAKIFEVFAHIIRNAQIKNIQNIFILTQMKSDKNIKKNKLYKSTFIPFALAISSFIVIAKKFFQKIIKNIMVKINNIKINIKSVLLINNIFQNKKEFISSGRFSINQIKKIHPAIQVGEIISFCRFFCNKFCFFYKKY
ncbi:MAG: hypothetical protein Q9M97_04185 [Candidatus Gracilibacteria bacterium]|nr:hypothetical protein [Candidatus Gracilibacteria bacterium]